MPKTLPVGPTAFGKFGQNMARSEADFQNVLSWCGSEHLEPSSRMGRSECSAKRS